MVRMKLEGSAPFHCLEDCETSVYRYRMATSEQARALSLKMADVSSHLTILLGPELDRYTKILLALTSSCYAHWWVTGLSSALCQENITILKNRSFTLPHTKQIENAKQNVLYYIQGLSEKLNFTEMQPVREYHSLYLEECAEIGAYTFLYGLEWGYNLLELGGLQKYTPNWEKIYCSLPLW